MLRANRSPLPLIARSSSKFPLSSGTPARSPALVPLRLVDRLPALQLPALQVDPTGINGRHRAPEPVGLDRPIANRPESQRADQASLRYLAVARDASAVAGTAAELRRVDPDQPEPQPTAVDAVAVTGARGFANVGRVDYGACDRPAERTYKASSRIVPPIPCGGDAETLAPSGQVVAAQGPVRS